MKTRLVDIAAIALLALYAGLTIATMRHTSGTYDEVVHLPPGYVSLVLADHRMNPDHPPLLRRLVALPLLFMDIDFRADDPSWRGHFPWEFGRRFLYIWNDADALLLRGRLVIVFLSCVLGMAVFAWTRRLFGSSAGLCALFLFALCPNMVAHGGVIANDMAITLALFAAVAAWERVCERVTWSRLALAAFVTGCALPTKFSGVALVAMIGVPAMALALSRAPFRLDLRWPSQLPRLVSTRKARLLLLAALAAVAALVAILTIWAGYGFASPTAADPAVNASFERARVIPENPIVAAGFRLLERSHLLPEAYVYGFQRFLAHTQTRPAFLMGRISETGFWYFFPMTLLLKTPIPLLVLVVIAAILAVRRPSLSRNEWFMWWPPIFYLLLSMTRTINIGHRHVLPLYPFFFVAAGRAGAWLFSSKSRMALLALLSLLAWHGIGSLRVYPHYLAYFNEPAGGPERGYTRLVDSSLDWGQELIGLRDYLRKQGIRRVKLAYFGTAEPAYYGIDAMFLPSFPERPRETHEVRQGDIVAISATILQGLYVSPEAARFLERFRAQRPLVVIGHSLFVYRSDFTGSVAP